MKICFFVLAALCFCLYASPAQDKSQERTFPTQCNPKPVPKAARPKELQEIESIQSYKRIPAVKFQINADGSVSDVKLIRSSGSLGIDRYALKTIA